MIYSDGQPERGTSSSSSLRTALENQHPNTHTHAQHSHLFENQLFSFTLHSVIMYSSILCLCNVYTLITYLTLFSFCIIDCFESALIIKAQFLFSKFSLITSILYRSFHNWQSFGCCYFIHQSNIVWWYRWLAFYNFSILCITFNLSYCFILWARSGLASH